MLDKDDIAYSLHSIRCYGGTTHDADILEALLGDEIAEYGDLIRRGMATENIAAIIDRMVWGPPTASS